MVRLNKVDACIIGSGAGGSVVAKELVEKGFSVVVLEAGRKFNPLQDYYISTLSEWEELEDEHIKKFSLPKIDKVTFGSEYIRRPLEVFGVGGGTLRYHANYLRMCPEDFRINTLDGVGADWPLSYNDLAPYYQKVELELGVSGKSGAPWFPDAIKYPNPPFNFAFHDKVLEKSFNKLGMRLWPNPVARISRPFDGRPACIQCGRCDDGCLIKAKSSADVTYIAKAELSGKAEIRPESVATRINIDSKGKAKSVTYINKNGEENEQEADVLIVSAGAIQSPRLLLNSKSSLFPDGLANSSGMVGKNYMVHTTIASYALLHERIDSFRGHGTSISLDHAKTDKKNSFARGFSIKPKSDLRGPVMTSVDVPGWGARHKGYMRKNYGHMAALRSLGENLPDEHNRVELDHDKVDDFGNPVPRLTFRPSENDKLIMDAMENKMREIWAAAGASNIEIHKSKSIGSAHNMGTCRMGNRRETSVVNSFCQCHDINNLFVVDASCFVTSGTANPSLTIQAIAKRSAEYIIKEGRQGNL